MTIYSILRQEMNIRKLYLPPSLLERVASSIGGHILNLAILDTAPNPIHDEHGQPMNARNHFVFIVPSAFGKSLLFRTLLRTEDGILGNVDLFQSSVRSTFSTESWMGTIDKAKDGSVNETEGVFARFKRGIVGADDYQPLKLLFEGSGLGNDEIYLMTALDTDQATKDLSYRSIEIKGIGLTLWAGMRPCQVTLKSGLARRFLFQTYYPSREQARILRMLDRTTCSTGQVATPNIGMRDSVKKAYDDILMHGKVKLDYSEINTYLEDLDIPHFEEKLYRRAALGLSVAMGYYPDIPFTAEAKTLIDNEMLTREQLRQSPYGYMIASIMLDEPNYEMPLRDLRRFMMMYYQMTEGEYKEIMSRVQLQKYVGFKTHNKVKHVVLNPDRVFLGE